MSDTATEVARLVGLHTPVPDRYETMSDELLEHYVYGLEKVLLRDDLLPTAKDVRTTDLVTPW